MNRCDKQVKVHWCVERWNRAGPLGYDERDLTVSKSRLIENGYDVRIKVVVGLQPVIFNIRMGPPGEFIRVGTTDDDLG